MGYAMVFLLLYQLVYAMKHWYQWRFFSFLLIFHLQGMTKLNMTLKHSRSSLTAADAKLSYTYMPIATSACTCYKCLQLERNH